MPALNRAERRLAARKAAHTKWATTDAVEGTAAARAAFEQKFLDQADPTGELEPAERARRADHLRSAYFADLALKSVKARRAKAAA